MVSARSACLTTLVTASCTIRYADWSTAGASSRGAPSTVTDERHAGRAGAVDQLVEVAEPGPARRSVPVVAQHPQRAVQLGHRAAAEVGDRVGRLADALVGRAERLRLHDHQRHVVADRVVQLARDPQALLGRRASASSSRSRAACRAAGAAGTSPSIAGGERTARAVATYAVERAGRCPRSGRLGRDGDHHRSGPADRRAPGPARGSKRDQRDQRERRAERAAPRRRSRMPPARRVPGSCAET